MVRTDKLEAEDHNYGTWHEELAQLVTHQHNGQNVTK